MEGKEISKAVIKRLPRYYRYLDDLRSKHVERISSEELSHLMKVTAAQIRQDLNNFGGFGLQGYGYNVEYLYGEIGRILGLDRTYNTVVIGGGNLGQTLARYTRYEKRGFYIRGIFDIDERLVGKKVRNVEIRPLDELEDFLRGRDIAIAILALPKAGALDVTPLLVQSGIKAIWNFAHVDLDVPDDVVVENVHLSESLMRLSYRLTNDCKNKTEGK